MAPVVRSGPSPSLTADELKALRNSPLFSAKMPPKIIGSPARDLTRPRAAPHSAPAKLMSTKRCAPPSPAKEELQKLREKRRKLLTSALNLSDPSEEDKQMFTLATRRLDMSMARQSYNWLKEQGWVFSLPVSPMGKQLRVSIFKKDGSIVLHVGYEIRHLHAWGMLNEITAQGYGWENAKVVAPRFEKKALEHMTTVGCVTVPSQLVPIKI